MYRVMIVDDEPVIRRGLSSFIPWHDLDCDLVYMAKDGLEAVEEFETHKPDIVLTDIKMPEMDGIELTKHIYMKYPSTKVIILTAYSDFSFAQSAIKYGVVDFVLKPTSSDKLIEAINKAKSIIKDEINRSSKINTLQDEITKSREELSESFLLKIINRVMTETSAIINRADSLGIKLDNYYGVVVETSRQSGNKEIQIGKNAMSQIPSLKNLIHVVLKDYRHYCVIVNNKCLCILINFGSGTACQNVQVVVDICNDIIHAVKSLVDINISMGISSLKNSIQNVGEAYEEGVETLSDKFYVDKNIFVYTGHKNIDDADTLCTINANFNSILKYVQSGEYENAADNLDRMFDIYRQVDISIRDAKNISMILYSCIFGFLPDAHNTNSDCSINMSSRIWHSQSVEEVYEILLSTIHLVISETKKADAYNHSVINIIDKYIAENYSKELTLTSIAKHVHLNSSYLSRLYKKDTGETLTEKITKVRIEKAKELLINTDLRIYEVSSIVGIENTNYFSILFKKYTSMYPKDYRTLSSNKGHI